MVEMKAGNFFKNIIKSYTRGSNIIWNFLKNLIFLFDTLDEKLEIVVVGSNLVEVWTVEVGYGNIWNLLGYNICDIFGLVWLGFKLFTWQFLKDVS